MGVEHLRLFTARQSPLPWWRSNLWEKKVAPRPPTPAGQKAPSTGKMGKTDRSGSRTPCRVQIHKRKTERRMPKGPILNFPQEEKIHWFLESYFTEASKAGRSEISAERRESGPTQAQLAHRAEMNTKQERALTQIVPSLEMAADSSEVIYSWK